MNELTPEQVKELSDALERLRDGLRKQLASTREGTRPVSLDEPIGRLTRMDAMQQQGVAAANRRSLDLRLRQVLQALSLIARGEFGACRRCEDPIGHARLVARPESPYCLDCQAAVDLKHG
jgi:DnaK suppressor protein